MNKFSFTGDDFRVSNDMKSCFNEYGYIIVRYSLFSVNIVTELSSPTVDHC